jgi:4-amino-4-deoxy-L-arabinose transferase-like glycosyltransferase
MTSVGAVCLLALVWRALLLWSGAATFHSDEAIVGLMARHITQGLPIPTFFYGQSYMGSLDSLLVSLVFRVAGEGVLGIRLVQMALYLGVLITAMLLASRLFADRRVTMGVGLLLAVGSPLFTLYTTISLGGYGEVLLLGNLLLLLGWELRQQPDSWWRWGAAGALLGMGWWTNALIVVYVLPVGLFLLPVIVRRRPLGGLLLAGVLFMLGSAPWWLYNLNHQWESVRFLLGGFGGVAQQERMSIPDKLIGLLFIGLPGVVGARLPAASTAWSPLGWGVLIGWLVLILASGVKALRARGRDALAPRYLWLLLLGFCALFLLSSFGADATGRYLLPLIVPTTILLVAQVRVRLGVVVIVGLAAWHMAGVVTAMRAPTGLTPQFDAVTDIPNTDDEAFMAFLQQEGLTRGYATYWVSFRLAFLSGETLIFAPRLPYKADLSPAGGDRYPAYTGLVAEAATIALITAKHPALDAAIEAGLRGAGISGWKTAQVGVYTVYYDLPRAVIQDGLGTLLALE